jgi:hypothetical protein
MFSHFLPGYNSHHCWRFSWICRHRRANHIFHRAVAEQESSGMKRETKNGVSPGVLFDSSCATAAQAATVEHESDRP